MYASLTHPQHCHLLCMKWATVSETKYPLSEAKPPRKSQKGRKTQGLDCNWQQLGQWVHIAQACSVWGLGSFQGCAALWGSGLCGWDICFAAAICEIDFTPRFSRTKWYDLFLQRHKYWKYCLLKINIVSRRRKLFFWMPLCLTHVGHKSNYGNWRSLCMNPDFIVLN